MVGVVGVNDNSVREKEREREREERELIGKALTL